MITIIGDIGFDIVKYNGRDIKSIGGSAFHTLIGCLCIQKNNPPYFMVSVGDDFDIKHIEDIGGNTQYICVVPNQKTARFIVNYENGKRDMTIEWGATINNCVSAIDQRILASNIIHLTATIPSKQKDYIVALKQLGFTGMISVDVWDQHCIDYPDVTRSVLDISDIVFMNADERHILNYEPKDIKKLYVFKQDEKGAICYYKKTKISSINCHIDKNRIVDLTGAGDVLAGALLTQLDIGIDLQDALNTSVLLATDSIQSFGTEHLLTHKKY